MVTARGRIALAAGAAARWSSRVTGRGAGAMIGGLVAMTLDKSILRQLGESRRTAIVTGTNGKSTTTRMTAAALGTLGPVATNAEGANMDAGLVAALAGTRGAELAALEVDEMHVPHVADAVHPRVIVLLNLSRDQLDRVGEINHIERTLRAGLTRHPDTVVVANCDDVLMTSAAYDNPRVVWVAAGGGWANDSVSCPRSGEIIVRDGAHWYSTGTDFKRPTPQWWYDDTNIYGPDGPFAADAARVTGSGQPRECDPGCRGGGRDGCRSRGRGDRGVGRRRGRGPVQHSATRDAHRADAAGQEPGGAGRKRCRWSTPTRVRW
jgi:UDP-N-acetylmuramyl tripeptide synthase